MRKHLLLLAALGGALALAATAYAAPPRHFSFDNSASGFAPFTSAACGTPVYITVTGTYDVTLYYDANGNVVRELDRIPDGTTTFSSPATGKSFTIRGSSVTEVDYHGGATLGSPAVVRLLGFQGSGAGPGTSVSAGQRVWNGTVDDFSPEGIPLVDFGGDPIFAAGTFPDFLTVQLPERCTALGGSYTGA